MGEKRDADRISMGKPEKKGRGYYFEDLGRMGGWN
jgi:hypothetical protein